jgi:hypothetical protein
MLRVTIPVLGNDHALQQKSSWKSHASVASVRSTQTPRGWICGHATTAAYHFSMHDHDRFKLLFGPYHTPSERIPARLAGRNEPPPKQDRFFTGIRIARTLCVGATL